MLTSEEKEKVQRGIWNETFTLFALPVILYDDVKEQLQKELFKGFGEAEDFEEGSKGFVKANKLKDNISRFSAAKVFQQVNDERNFLLDETGNIRSFFDFKKDADKIYGKYNTEWMKVERQATIANAQSAAQWIDIQETKEVLPLLQYRTAGDERVRPEHQAWEGITRPADDPFWDSHNPPNGFNCFEPNTKVLTPDGWKKISAINKGDYIIGGSGEKRNVTGVHINDFIGNLIRLSYNNTYILGTQNHKIQTLNGWVPLGEISMGDEIVKKNNPVEILELDSISRYPYKGNVCNLSVDIDESYITELGIVHNCRCIVVQLEAGRITDLRKRQQEIKRKSDGELSIDNTDKLFAINSGKQDFIFKEKGTSPHPYFKVPKEFEGLKKRNFDLPL